MSFSAKGLAVGIVIGLVIGLVLGSIDRRLHTNDIVSLLLGQRGITAIHQRLCRLQRII